MPGGRPWRCTVLVACVLLAAAACDRRPRFVARGTDSTAVMGADSLEVLAQKAADLWDRAQDRRGVAEASAATAQVARRFLAARGAPVLAEGLSAYLDSLGVGVEVAADPRDSNLAAANFFSRTNPDAGSEPWLLWREGSEVRSQAVEGRGLRLFQAASRSFPASEAALLFGRPAPGGYEPLLLVLRRNPGSRGWQLSQSVGSDSLGGTGRVQFVRQDTTLVARARTFFPSARFEECGSCPHIYRQRVLAWGPDGFHIASDRVEPSPYQSFVEFVNAVSLGDSRLAASLSAAPMVLHDALRYGWDRSAGPWRVAPGLEESSDQMVFYRGAKEAYRVSFELHEGRWLVAGIEPTSRAIE